MKRKREGTEGLPQRKRRRIIEELGNSEVNNTVYDNEHYIKGELCYNEKDYDEAIKELNIAIEENPGIDGYYFLRGKAYSSKRQFITARINYDHAIELNSNLPEYFIERGYVFLKLGIYNLAYIDFTSSIILNSNDPIPYHYRGIAYLKIEEYEKTIVNCKASIRLDPTKANVYFTLGQAYAKMKFYHKSVKEYTTAINMSKKSKYFYSRACSYYQMEEYDKFFDDIYSISNVPIVPCNSDDKYVKMCYVLLSEYYLKRRMYRESLYYYCLSGYTNRRNLNFTSCLNGITDHHLYNSDYQLFRESKYFTTVVE